MKAAMKFILTFASLALLPSLYAAQAAESTNQTFAKMTELIAEANARGIDVLYWQAAAIPMRVGLNERWKSFPEERSATLEYVEQRGQEIIREIRSVLAGNRSPGRCRPSLISPG